MQNTSENPTLIADMIADRDRHNLAIIDRALASGRIDADTAKYLGVQYSDGMDHFREVFYFLGKCFGAPKAPVNRYDYITDAPIDEPIKISDINPTVPYIVQHRLDMDPMRNQFFTSGAGHKIDLAVSSIVTVIVGAQKNIDRAIDKITGKYYRKYVDEVVDTTVRVITGFDHNADANTVAQHIRKRFESKYISSAPEVVLSVIGAGHEHLAVELVRELDKIRRPHTRLRDVWRVKCLFDLVPQARTFIERVREMMPDRIIWINDKFYDMENISNYRDAKVVINIGDDKNIIPMEIMCQVRTFFEYERQTHTGYEQAREDAASDTDKIASLHDSGVQQYNLMIVRCLDDLFERVGWNILYSQNNDVPMFDGFPKKCTMYYPQKMVDAIMDKLDTAIKNEVFYVTNAPVKLDMAQECAIFHFMTNFVLVAAMPYGFGDWTVPTDTMAGRLFNFVMKEVQRYYKR